MAISRAARRPARILIAVTVAAVSLTLSPGIGSAEPDPAPPTAASEPQTTAEAQQQFADLSHELEVVTEQYNDAVILRDQREQEVAVAQAQLRAVQADVAELDVEVRQIARGAYTGDAIASFTALMTSGSPQEFLDRVNTLEAISGHNNSRARELVQAQLQAGDLAAQAAHAQAAAEATAADIEAKKARIETDLPVAEALLASLAEQDRQAALALAASHGQAGDPAARGSERASRGNERQDSEDVPPAPVSAPTQAAQIAVDTAYAQLGDPYVWAADGPDSFDCSGLTMYSYAAAGISLPHSSRMQSSMGLNVSRSQLQPGDLVFYYSPVSHVAIYVGNGQVIHAPNTGGVVQLADVDMWGAYSHAQRVALP
ncbi:MAG: C40 family peptidase [Actinomycetota bacterium]|nr:C40 family peptidase [Actinomycetota bacterium]